MHCKEFFGCVGVWVDNVKKKEKQLAALNIKIYFEEERKAAKVSANELLQQSRTEGDAKCQT